MEEQDQESLKKQRENWQNDGLYSKSDDQLWASYLDTIRVWKEDYDTIYKFKHYYDSWFNYMWCTKNSKYNYVHILSKDFNPDLDKIVYYENDIESDKLNWERAKQLASPSHPYQQEYLVWLNSITNPEPYGELDDHNNILQK